MCQKKKKIDERSKYWLTGLLLTTSLAFAENDLVSQSDSQSCIKRNNEKQMTAPACKTPAGIRVSDAWDFFAWGTFTYWNPSQDNMELGIISDASNSLYWVNGNMVNLHYEYKPGFKIGLGVNLDRDYWDLLAEYTWFRGDQTKHISLDPTGNKGFLPRWAFPSLFSPEYFGGKEKWRLHMDLLDFVLSRDYCVTNSIDFCTLFGVRAAWIRQNLSAYYLNETTGLWAVKNVQVTSNSNSWAVGPKVALHTNWLLGKGCRIYGNGAGDLLFTRYTHLRFHQQGTTSTGAVGTGFLLSVREKDVNCMRGHLELEFGLGWGTYFSHHHSHVDLSAGYGFQVFFDQNMFRIFLDDQSCATSLVATGNLYVHGLNTSLRFDF